MDLVTRFLARRRDSLLMRLGCWLVCFSLVIGLMLPQQRAEAVVTELTMTAVASVAAAYLGACGLSFITRGMDKDALVNSCQRLIQEFLDTELGGISIQDWVGSVWDIVVMAGKLVMGRPLTDKFVSFAQWVAQKYAAQVGENVVYEAAGGIKMADGSTFALSVWDGVYEHTPTFLGDKILYTDVGTTYFASGAYFTIDENGSFILYDSNGERLLSTGVWSEQYIFISIIDSAIWLCFKRTDWSGFNTLKDITSYVTGSPATFLGIDRAEIVQQILDRLTALEEGQSIALDVGAAQSMEIQEILQSILDATLAGNLAATAEIVDEKAEPVDPPAGEIPDVEGLGLPALGAALTSRFPFSIPWDLFRAVKLLAAPAKAPYFEVDFMEPLADEVGGWNGSTTVVLDFSQYAIIGQVCRWTSTIGFCMMLASATKRLIWTA